MIPVARPPFRVKVKLEPDVLPVRLRLLGPAPARRAGQLRLPPSWAREAEHIRVNRRRSASTAQRAHPLRRDERPEHRARRPHRLRDEERPQRKRVEAGGPQTVRPPRPVLGAFVAAERVRPLAALALRRRFTLMCSASRAPGAGSRS